MYYIRLHFLNSMEWILLEIKLPREIYKSPQAMEIFLNTLHQTRDGNYWEKYWKGYMRGWFSLEIASIGGNIRFFVYTTKFFRNMIEQQIYSQYPEVEISLTDDYTKNPFKGEYPSDWNFWGAEFIKTKPAAYPIKTYVDYKLNDLATEEEQKNDPVTSMLEFMGSIKDGEQVWFQIIIRASKNEDKWKEGAAKITDEMMKRARKPEGGKIDFSAFTISPGERLVTEAVERAVSKIPYDVMIRGIYLAEKDKYDKVNQASLVSSMKQFNSLNLNGFKPSNTTTADFWYQKNKFERKRIRAMNAYRLRSCFYTPYVRKTYVMNTEELATIFHFPGSVARTPTLSRIEAKKGEPPAGLPI